MSFMQNIPQRGATMPENEEENWRKPESEQDKTPTLAEEVAIEIQKRLLKGEKVDGYPRILLDL